MADRMDTGQAAALARALWDADPFLANVIAETCARGRRAVAMLAACEHELALSADHGAPLSLSAQAALIAAEEADAALLGLAAALLDNGGRRALAALPVPARPAVPARLRPGPRRP